MSYELKEKAHHLGIGQDLGDLLIKEARVFGESAPDAASSAHAGIPYKTRKRMYMNYAKVKAQEPKTGWATALGTGGGIGGLLGGVATGRGEGFLAGAIAGGLVGAVMKLGDDFEVDSARSALRGGRVADDVMAHRMALEYRKDQAEARAEARANARYIRHGY